jgi:hypothetical protein
MPSYPKGSLFAARSLDQTRPCTDLESGSVTDAVVSLLLYSLSGDEGENESDF